MKQQFIYTFADRMQHMPESFIREILKVSIQPEVISFAGGLPNPSLFPVLEMAKAAEKVLEKHGKEILQYSTTEGYMPLREFIADRQSNIEGSKIFAEQVIILNGSQQGLDLIGKIFINKGTEVLMEGPTYLGAIQAFSAYEPFFREIPLHEGGPDAALISATMERRRPDLFYFVPNYQNPTGNTYGRAIREHLAELSGRTGTLLIEDNPYGELGFGQDPLPNLHALAPEHTIYLGSFSKVISPGLRVGWAIAPKEVAGKLTIAKQASDLHTGFLAQRILFQYLYDNSLDLHLEKIRQFYKQQAEHMLVLIEKYFPEEVKIIRPKGGMFLWISLPDALDASSLLAESMEKNVLFVPGQHFYISSNPKKNCMRLNFSNPSYQEMEKGIKLLGQLIRQLCLLKAE